MSIDNAFDGEPYVGVSGILSLAKRHIRLLTVVAVLAFVVPLLSMTVAVAQDDDSAVTGLSVDQEYGFATLGWSPVEDAVAYEIERTPVDDAGVPTGPSEIVGVWRPNRQVSPEAPVFADSGFVPGDRFQWRVRATLTPFPNEVTIDAPSSAAGTYKAHGASFGPRLGETGPAGDVVLVDDGSSDPTLGCGSPIGFPAGAIALVDRGECSFVQKVRNAQAAGATGVIVVNNEAGAPINMTGNATDVTIPSVMVWQSDGEAIKAGLPATGALQSALALPFSEPVIDTTRAAPGPEEFRTPWETTEDAQFTSHEFELAWTNDIAEASDRVRVETLGHTVEGRPINLFIIGDPPLETAAEISESPTVGANCNVHGNEPSGREACFMMIRELAFSDDPWVEDILSNTTVLIVPSLNGDGRAANQRGNATGQDLNRDHGLLAMPETFSLAAFFRDYTPEVMVDGHEFGRSSTCDLPLLWSRHSNTAPTVHNEGKEGLVEGHFYAQSAVGGWWPCPYPLVGLDGATSFTRVTGLKNMVVTLVEARSQGGPTRPGEAGAENRRRKGYSQLWSIREAMNYHRENLPTIQQAIEEGIEFQSSNTGPAVLHGDWDVEAFPAPHPGDTPPPNNPPGPDDMINPPPCGYQLTAEQYSTPIADGRLPSELETSAGERLVAHGIRAVPRGTGQFFVPMAQPLRGLINIVLDEEQPPQPIVAGVRVFDCYPMAFSGVADVPELNRFKAGATRSIRFSLDGDRGLDILVSDSPTSRSVDCDTLIATGSPEPTETPGRSGLSYDPEADEYNYPWKTSSGWAGTCREFAIGLDDGSSHAVHFQFH